MLLSNPTLCSWKCVATTPGRSANTLMFVPTSSDCAPTGLLHFAFVKNSVGGEEHAVDIGTRHLDYIRER
ncbi:unnamed protein product [Periconia digitata]|uniref:Uncharacterized protein n=1 Tax=Periconia digitata TaxID=1303443 RepID=A0A9W4U3N8_9PLEO|nr:unnamed protein product [Periconia digitata]